MEDLEMNFPRLKCANCLSEHQIVKKRGPRYGIYCKDCNLLLMWAGEHEKVVINARLEWLKNNKEVST